ncbi:ORF38 [Leucania separata nucleopolyhedrovirus]|uniref:ORF38 n=1 Tax=Leucania separata nucleopolyhedrovirus TaxID=1307956 RepID=Q0IL81_NPVLS|nr:ORF38 [Leucania separata nucleopolyhedrovirus]AAR28802.1 ORF38 [Leucania separata nucleopolyhedrovirus]
MRCSGLLMINDEDKAILLHASQSYQSKQQHRHRDCTCDRDDAVYKEKEEEASESTNFLEKISIPRGKWDSRDIFDYETAIREFIEETGTIFEGAYVYRRPFMLRWTDNNVNYTYMIYVALLNGSLLPLQREPNTFCVKLSRQQNNRYVVEFEDRRYLNREIQRALRIVPTRDYFRYMREHQLTTYESSNYLDFFTFVENVKNTFDSSLAPEAFFYLELRLHKWPKASIGRRPRSAAAPPIVVTTTKPKTTMMTKQPKTVGA